MFGEAKARIIIYELAAGKAKTGGALGGNFSMGNGASLNTSTQNALQKSIGQSLVPIAPNKADEVFVVQFNPASLRLSANAETTEVKALQSHMNPGALNQHKRDAAVTLSVDLLFDAVNNFDAFGSDKKRLLNPLGGVSADSLTGAAANIARHKKGTGFTVLPQTQGLIAAVTDVGVKQLAFCWADILFPGELEQVQAQYTMFSPEGNPIRSKVSLVLKQILQDEDVPYWDNAFSKFWGDTGTDSTVEGKSTFDKLGNLLNVRI